ncbi:hypothetical protein U1Q18_046798 [Sarracenia purpurea var. burkii]
MSSNSPKSVSAVAKLGLSAASVWFSSAAGCQSPGRCRLRCGGGPGMGESHFALIYSAKSVSFVAKLGLSAASV